MKKEAKCYFESLVIYFDEMLLICWPVVPVAHRWCRRMVCVRYGRQEEILLCGLLAGSAPALRTTRITEESEKLPIRHGGMQEIDQVREFLSNIAFFVFFSLFP